MFFEYQMSLVFYSNLWQMFNNQRRNTAKKTGIKKLNLTDLEP